MKEQFPYQEEKSRLFGEICRPVVGFDIETNEGWIPIVAYADSGADVTLLPKSFIDLLDVKFKEEDIKDIGGIGGGKVPVVIESVKMKICKKIIDAKVAIALIEEVPYLLGRETVFEYFKICFRQKYKLVYFEPE